MVFDSGEDGGLNEEALVAHSCSSTLQPGSLLLPTLYQIHNLVKLLSVNLEPAPGTQEDKRRRRFNKMGTKADFGKLTLFSALEQSSDTVR